MKNHVLRPNGVEKVSNMFQSVWKIIIHDQKHILYLNKSHKGRLKGWQRLFADFGFFCKKNQKFSTVTSNRHLGMGVGAFESLDNEVTFFFLFYGYKTHRKNSRGTQTWQLLGFSWLILDT